MDNLYKEFANSLATEMVKNKIKFTDKEISNKLIEFIKEKNNFLMPKLLKIALKRSKKDNKKNKSFLKRNMKRWKKPFQLLDALILICKDSGSSINQSFRNSNDTDILLDILLRLHADSCLKASEIAFLMKGGYANGAYSQWRSLYETYITALFIEKHGKECAQRFADHSIVDYFNLMKRCITHKDKINQTPPSEDEYNQCEKTYKAILAKYEKDFEKPYGWAKKFIEVRPTFTAIEAGIDQSHLRFYYSKVSTATHCSYYGLINKLGLSETTQDVLLVGPSNSDMLEAGNAVSLTLTQITCILLKYSALKENPNTEKILLMDMLNTIQNQITEKFMEVHHK